MDDYQKMRNEERRAISDNVKFLLWNCRIPKRILASIIGYSVTTITAWQKGKRMPSPDAVSKIAAFFHREVADLRIPIAKEYIETRLDGLTIQQWRKRALLAEKKIILEEHRKAQRPNFMN